MFWCQSVRAPDRVLIEAVSGTPTLSWEARSEAQLFRIFRAEHVPNAVLGVENIPQNVDFVGDFADIGTTDEPFFQDLTAEAGARYSYYVQAESTVLNPSEPSNIVVAPPEASPVTLDEMDTLLSQLAAGGKVKAWTVRFLLRQTRDAMSSLDLARADRTLAVLQSLIERRTGLVSDAVKAEDFGMKVVELRQRLRLAREGVVPVAALIGEEGI
jgi:hypothetical protein